MPIQESPSKKKLQHLASGRSESYKLHHSIVLVEDGFNERRDYGDIPALASDIYENGILIPFIVRKPIGEDYVLIVEGHRRRKAVDLLLADGRWKDDATIPCISEKQRTTQLSRLFIQLSANSGKNLTLLEKARLYQRIRAESITEGAELSGSDIARRSGTTKQAVSNALAIVDKGSPHLISLIETESIAATTALEIIRSHPEHLDQDAAADLALSSTSGRATPKHLPTKPKTSQAEDTTQTTEVIYDSNKDEEEEDDNQEEATRKAEAPKKQEPILDNSPSDPNAIDRIKNTTSSSTGFSGGGSFNEGSGSTDTRLKNIENALEKMEEDGWELNPTKKETVELIINILKGDSTTASLKSFLRL